MISFVSFDFETANEKRGSACSIGLAKFNDAGQLVDTFQSRILPHETLRYFNPVNTWTHGLTLDDVVEAPEWGELLPAIRKFVGDLPVIAHNMAFDGYVVNDLASLYQEEAPSNQRICTLRISRALLGDRLASRKLPIVFNYYYPDEAFAHHDSSADAIAAGRVFTAMQGEFGIEELRRVGVAGTGKRASVSGTRSSSQGPGPTTTPIEELIAGFGTSQLLEGETICITGTLSRGKRDDIHTLVSHLGGIPAKSLTKKTSILVFGIPNPRAWKQDAKGSAKLVKASELREKGSPIEVLSEDAFFDRLDDLYSAAKTG